ncbi:hypothetical protein LCGC14_2904040 [marine sediment metagenome]|uniref:Uncharacterized protein n=1 Tax=marine sediment metagenome TaxID=412755 RepID=A0A0F9AJT0_9ZZZZ
MNQLKVIDLCKFGIFSAYISGLFHQKLIDEWNDPTDIATRAAVLIKDTHEVYAGLLLSILKEIKTNCKHPKKYQDVCEGIRYCTNCNLDLKK